MPALTISAVNGGTDQITATAHGQVTGAGPAAVFVGPGGVIPGGLAPVTNYWLVVIDANTVKLADSSAHALANVTIDITSTGTLPLQLLIGLPYRRPMTAVAGAQIKSANDNSAWDSLVALWNALTGQAQAIWSAVVLAVALSLTTLLEATVTPMATFRDWKNQIRTTVDHFGYRGGLVTEWEEQWKTTGTGAPVGWTFGIVAGASATLTDPSSTFRQRYNRLLVVAGGGTTSITATPEWCGYMDNDSEIVLEFSVRTEVATGGTATQFHVGLQFGSAGSNDDFIYFRGAGGTANWQADSVVNGAAPTAVDTGIAFAANTNYRFRIEAIGSNNSSQAGGTFQYRFFINGVLVVTTNLATIVADKFRPFLRGTNTTGTQDGLQVGRLRLQFNHVLSGDSV